MKLKSVEPSARTIVEKLKEMFPGCSVDPVVQDSDHWGSSNPDVRYVCWEEGPYEWAMHVSNPDSRWNIKLPGIFLEPYNPFVLAVIPEDVKVPTGKFLTDGVWSDEPAGYLYNSSVYCPDDLRERMIHHHDMSPGARGMGVEEALNQIAIASGINRMDEFSFDSDEFPKVVHEAGQSTRCDVCGKRLPN